MKKLYPFLIILVLGLSSFNTNSQTIVWTDNFVGGVAPTPAQITTWNNFRAQLLGTYSYTKMTISGTFDPVGKVCTDPTIVTAYANALRTLTSYTSPMTNGNVWSLCGTRYQGEVWLNPPSQCDGSNCPTGYILRPGSGYACCWGGVNTPTCATVTQTMTFTFEYTSCSPTAAPTLTCPANITVNNDAGQCDAVVNFTAPVGTDNCGNVTTTQTAGLASGATFPVGTTTNTFSSTNSQGTTTCSFTVTVVDNEAPALTCPANITVNNDAGQCDAVVTYTAPVGTDNCSGVTTALTSGPASGSTFPVGTTTVTYTATDAASNSTPCSFTVTVVDAEAPTITCGGNVTSCDSVVTYTAPVGTDNCAGATTALSSGLASGSTFPVGTTTIWHVVTDASGNKDSCSFDVVVHPLPSIVLNTFNDDTVCLADNPLSLPAANPTGGSYSGPGIVGSTFDPSTAGVGTHYIVYTYTDANSCTNSDSTMIVVESCVGINENGSLAGVSIYPNPTNGLININLGDHNGSVNYSITTIKGRLVTQERNVTSNNLTINLSQESKGIYLLKIEDATSSGVYKIIKE